MGECLSAQLRGVEPWWQHGGVPNDNRFHQQHFFCREIVQNREAEQSLYDHQIQLHRT